MNLLYTEEGGSVELIDWMGNDLTVVNSARVSMHKEHVVFDEEKDSALLQYLAENKHWTPFAHPQLQFRIKMPIPIVRQWFKSTVGLVRNEVSRRYVSDEPEFAKIHHFRLKDTNIKQGSSDIVSVNNEKYVNLYNLATEFCKNIYLQMIADDICPEQARYILPQGMFTEFIETGSLYAFIRIIGLRTDPHAQKEIQAYANLIEQNVKDIFPYSYRAFYEHSL